MQEKVDLEGELKSCKSCTLCRNGHFPPQWSEKSKYATLMTYPYENEPVFMIKFWDMAKRMGLNRDHFVQLNTVNCLPDVKKRGRYKGTTVRPSQLHRSECKKWISRYIDVFDVRKMIAFGNIPMEECIGEFNGINERTGSVVRTRINNRIIPTVLCIHPKGIDDPENKHLIREAIKTFREI